MTNVTIAPYQPSTNPVLAVTLINLEEKITEAAQANVLQMIAGGDYTETEIYAMTVVEKLKAVNGLDLAAVLFRGKYIKEIREKNLLSLHPGRDGGYRTLRDMAKDQGISASELDRTDDLCNIIFPWVTENLGMPIAQFWESIGKSNLIDLLPILKALITGEAPTHGDTRASVARVLEDVRENAVGEVTGDELRFRAIGQLIEHGQLLPNRELRNHIRPDRTPNIQAIGFDGRGAKVMVLRLEPSQEAMFWRLVGRHVDTHDYAGDQPPTEIFERFMETA